MELLLSAADSRALDALAAERLGLDVDLLMEHAGRSVAELAAPLCRTGRAVIFAGPGNNGGDGLVAARHLVAQGLRVEVVLAVAPVKLRGVAKLNLERWRRFSRTGVTATSARLGEGDLVIDALLGTGLSRAPEGKLREAIRRIERARRAGAAVVSVDVPSGLDADTGTALGDCVQADLTVTFGARKRGLAQEPGATLAGRVEIGSLGLPADLLGKLDVKASVFERGDLLGVLPNRARAAFKNSFGHVLVLAGSPGKSGAGTLAVRAALRSGAGLVTLAGRPEALPEILAGHPEAMAHALPGQGALGPDDLAELLSALDGKTAFAVGPGLWRGPQTGALLREVLKRFEGPTVLDADALNAIAGERGLLRSARGETVVTPHPGEMGRLLGHSGAAVQAQRFAAAETFAREEQTVVVLKGAGTIVSHPDGRLSVNPTGNAGLAHGGTGDVLCGLIGGLLAQGLSAFDAARAGAYLHGWAGESVSARVGQRGLTAGEVADALGPIWAELGC